MRQNRIELVGTVKNVNIRRCNCTQRIKLSVETEDLHEGIKLRIPVTVWESNINSNIDLLAIGTTAHIVGKVRVQSQTTAYHMERTVRDLVASHVDIIDAN